MAKLYLVQLLVSVHYMISVNGDCGVLNFRLQDAPGYNLKGCTKYPDGNTNTGSTATLKCQRGYRLEGPETTTCMSRGRWDIEGTTPNCRENDCKNPEINFNVENGGIVGVKDKETDWYSFGSAYTVICNDGYRVQGEPLRTCLDDGTWSGDLPQCEPIPGYTVPITPAPCICNYTNTTQSPIGSSPITGNPCAEYVLILYALAGFSGVSLMFWFFGCICSARYCRYTRGNAKNPKEFASCESLWFGCVVSVFQFVLPLALIPGSCCKMKRLRKFLGVGERSDDSIIESIPLNRTAEFKLQRQMSRQIEEKDKLILELKDKVKKQKERIKELCESGKDKGGDRCTRYDCVKNATLLERANEDTHKLETENQAIKQKLDHCGKEKAAFEKNLAVAHEKNHWLCNHIQNLQKRSNKIAQKTLDLPDEESREQVMDYLSSVSTIKTADGVSDLKDIISDDNVFTLRHKKGGASNLTDIDSDSNTSEATTVVENNYKGTQESVSDSPEGRDFKSQLSLSLPGRTDKDKNHLWKSKSTDQKSQNTK